MEGYAQLAQRMFVHKDLSIVRRFDALNAQNILYLQAELMMLEERLRKKHLEDCASDEEEKRWSAHDWQTLQRVGQDSGGSETQWKIFLQIREKLKEYNEALAQQALIASLNKPSSNSLDVINSYLKNANTSDYLLGIDKDVWSNEALKSDLISLHPVLHTDHFTMWLIKAFLGTFHNIIGKRYKPTSPSDPSVVDYNDSHLQIPAMMCATFLSSMLPVLSIVVLYLVDSIPKRLGIMAAFTATFSLALTVMTSTKRVENFAATAAFAAVQVVFIGTNGPLPN